jgi:transposase
MTDVIARPIVLHLTGGQAHDSRMATAMIEQAGPIDRLIADRTHDANALRASLHEVGIKPVIPGKSNRNKPIRLDKRRYKDRWRIEATIGRLKDFRRIATRYDKIARTFKDVVTIAAIVLFWC